MTGEEWEASFGPVERYEADELENLADTPANRIWTEFERADVIECRPGRHADGVGYWEANQPWERCHAHLVVTTEVGPLGITDPTSDAHRSAEIENVLAGCWVVILHDPDYADWSPWPVFADSREMAIARARRDWRRWCHSPDRAEVVKVYKRSWCGGIV